MRIGGARVGLLREQREGGAEVRPVELFFDLVYVLAVTQLTHGLLDDLTLRGAVETLVLLLAVWGAWIDTTWKTNYFDLSARPVRLVLIGVMLASLVMSASIPGAFASRGLAFAAALVAILVGGTAALLALTGRRHRLSAVFQRLLVWWLAVGSLWLAGGLTHGDVRIAIWAVAAVLIYVAMSLGFPAPRLGRSRTTDYTIAGGHMAHRCSLFIILALGESILVTGSSFGELPSSAGTGAAFVVAFVGSVAFWWIYFDRGAEAGLRVISAATDPGRLGLTAYTFFHIPMVAGIIAAAAGDELAISHPGEEVGAASALLILGGPALYLLGNALFKQALWGHVPASRPVALVALAAVAPIAIVSSTLVLLTIATAVVIAVAVWDALTVAAAARSAAS